VCVCVCLCVYVFTSRAYEASAILCECVCVFVYTRTQQAGKHNHVCVCVCLCVCMCETCKQNHMCVCGSCVYLCVCMYVHTCVGTGCSARSNRTCQWVCEAKAECDALPHQHAHAQTPTYTHTLPHQTCIHDDRLLYQSASHTPDSGPYHSPAHVVPQTGCWRNYVVRTSPALHPHLVEGPQDHVLASS
jgi:hypothetical protein